MIDAVEKGDLETARHQLCASQAPVLLRPQITLPLTQAVIHEIMQGFISTKATFTIELDAAVAISLSPPPGERQ